jgi:pyruvate-ferredoxin/flavodoxin oxidoreductase
MAKGMQQQKLAVDSGYWPLYRYNPTLKTDGKNPLRLDSRAPKIPLEEYVYNETRYRMLTQSNPQAARHLLAQAQEVVKERWQKYEQMASMG